MVRAPYPARIVAGLVVTALEETKKLPALVVTLPMTAVSQTLQAGMRMQQNIAELAIKGDAALDSLFDRPDEQPSWARFDEDEPTEPIVTPITRDIGNAATADSVEEGSDGVPAEPAPAKKAAPKAPAKTAPAKKVAAKKAPAKKAQPKKAADTSGEQSTASSGRFALYSTPPEDLVVQSDAAESRPTSTGPVPEIVEYIEYDHLTLAQLRAKLRGVGVDELEELAAYEQANKARAPFVTMIDNRIASQNGRRQTDS